MLPVTETETEMGRDRETEKGQQRERESPAVSAVSAVTEFGRWATCTVHSMPHNGAAGSVKKEEKKEDAMAMGRGRLEHA